MTSRSLLPLALLFLSAPGFAAGKSDSGMTIKLVKPERFTGDQCVRRAQVRIQTQVTASSAPQNDFYLLPILKLDKYYAHPEVALTFQGTQARAPLTLQFGQADDHGIQGELNLYVVTEPQLNKAKKAYGEGGTAAPSDNIFTYSGKRTSISMERCAAPE